MLDGQKRKDYRQYTVCTASLCAARRSLPSCTAAVVDAGEQVAGGGAATRGSAGRGNGKAAHSRGTKLGGHHAGRGVRAAAIGLPAVSLHAWLPQQAVTSISYLSTATQSC